MIYTNRKYLSILTLTENRDYVTYDELIHVLTERPSNAVYIERDGILCGLITSGRIMRSRDEETRRVPFSKKFTSVHPEEYLRARQIFRNKDNVNVLPVVSEDGRLLGDYMRGNDFIGMDYVKLLCKDPYVLRDLKTEIQNAILVKPILHRGREYKGEAFLWWIQNLESEDIHLQVIQPWEIKDYSDKILLFVDEDEKSGIAALNRHLYPNKKEANVKFITIANYLDQIKRLASARANTSILKALQNQGDFVLIFDFMENSNHFLAVLDERIKRRNEKYSVEPTPFNMLPEELKEPFADELYCEAYKAQEFPCAPSYCRPRW